LHAPKHLPNHSLFCKGEIWIFFLVAIIVIEWYVLLMRNISIVIAVVLLAFVFGLLASSVPLAADNTTMGHIVGVAVDAEGKGVAGVTVTVHAAGVNPRPLVTGTTDEKGAFRVDVAAPMADLVVDLKQDVKPFPTSATKTGVAVEQDKTTDLGKIEMKIG
jgi:hypothetical protein